jgi:hypothetical protein
MGVDEDENDAAVDAARERSAVPHPRDIIRREYDERLKGRRRSPALEKWGPEIEVEVMRELAGGK